MFPALIRSVDMNVLVYLVHAFCRPVARSGGFPGGSVAKIPPANAGDAGSIPGPGRSPGDGKGNTLQYSCLGNHTDRGAWQATVHGVSKGLDKPSTYTTTTATS